MAALGPLLFTSLALGAGKTSPTAATSRQGHIAVLLRDGSVLVVGGYDPLGPSVAQVERFVPWSGWEVVSPAANVSGLSAAAGALLHDGRVLLVGDGTHLYDPASGRFADAGSTGLLQADRTGHTLTVLRDGAVFLAGGVSWLDAGQPVPMLGRSVGNAWDWTPVNSGGAPPTRHRHTATLLEDGTVLLVGGSDTESTQAAADPLLLFDPDAGTFKALDAGAAPFHRVGHSTSRRHSGELAIIGDSQAGGVGVLLQRSTSGWTVSSPMSTSLQWPSNGGHSAVVAPNQAFLAFGGCAYLPCSSSPRQTAAVQYTSPGGWSAGPPLAAGRGMHTSTLLMDGKVLVVGGGLAGEPTWELLDPVGFEFLEGNPDGGSFARPGTAAVPLPSGDVALVGGQGPLTRDALARVSSTGVFTEDGSDRIPHRVGHTATVVNSNELLILGGVTPAGVVLDDCWLVALNGATLKPCRPMPLARAYHAATLLADGRVLVSGGQRPGDLAPRDEAMVFNPGPLGGTWTAPFSLRSKRASHAAVLLPSGQVLLSGGYGGEDSSELVDAQGASSTSGPPLAEPRRFHAAALLRDGRVLLAGGEDESARPSATLEVLGFDGGFAYVAGAAMPEPRPRPAAVALPTGEVVIAGGVPGDGGYSVSRWSPLFDDFSGRALLKTAREAPQLVLGNQGDVFVGGGTSRPAPFELFRTFAGTRQHMAHGLVAVAGYELLSSGGAPFKFQLIGDWRSATEASTGGPQSSPVNLPRLVFQRLDNGQVFVPAGYTFSATKAELSGPAPGLPQGQYRAWAYVSGIPGGAAWFRVGTRVTGPWDAGAVGPGDAGSPDGGGASDGGLGGEFGLAVKLSGSDPRLVGTQVGVRIVVSAPAGTPGDQLVLRLAPSADLSICTDAAGCQAGGQPSWTLAGVVGADGKGAVDLAVLPRSPGSHTLGAHLEAGDQVRASGSASLEAVQIDLRVGLCGCSAGPLPLGGALFALWALLRRRGPGRRKRAPR